MKKHPALRHIALCFLGLYLTITLLPPALYYALPGEPSDADGPEKSPEATEASDIPEPSETPESSPLPGPLDGRETGFALRDADGRAITVDAREFLIGGLACEMDPQSPQEALKAQAVAACTYYTRLTSGGGEIPCDRENWQVYVDEAGMKARWGEDCGEYRGLLEQAVDAVLGQTLAFGGEPILAAYFAISPGSTESAENVWPGESQPYLQAVASPGDSLADGYLSCREFTPDELRAALNMPDLSGDPAAWFTDADRTPSGTVKSVSVGGKTFTGPELRGLLGLRSACFTWEADGDALRFTVHGWGHGVGLSQAGAAFMAKSGAGYREILEHYYPGAEIVGG